MRLSAAQHAERERERERRTGRLQAFAKVAQNHYTFNDGDNSRNDAEPDYKDQCQIE